MAIEPQLSSGVLSVLTRLVACHEGGSASLILWRLSEHSVMFPDPTIRRARILVKHGYAELVDEDPTHQKYRATPRGIARFDIEWLNAT